MQDLPVMVGVGDVIHYDANDIAGRDSIAFIHKRLDAKVFLVTNAAGWLPNPTTEEEDWAIYRAYTSLANALSMTENENLPDFDADYLEPRQLVSHNRVHHIACYADDTDTDPVQSLFGWETDEDHYLHIFTPVSSAEAGASQRHTGKWTADAYTLERSCVDYVNMLRIGSAMTVHIEGLQIHKKGSGTTSCNAVQLVNDAVVYLSDTLIRGSGTNGSGVHLSSAYARLNMWNNVITTAAVDRGDAITLENETHAFIYNNTLYDSYHGVGGQGTDCPNVVLINNIAIGNTANGGGDFRSGMSFSPSSSHNCSSDQTAEEVNDTYYKNNAPATCLKDGPNGDLHLAEGCPCINMGTGLSSDPDLPFDDDIDGDKRPLGIEWDPGADEYEPG